MAVPSFRLKVVTPWARSHFWRGCKLSGDRKEYSVSEELLTPKGPNLPCSHVKHSLEAAEPPWDRSWDCITMKWKKTLEKLIRKNTRDFWDYKLYINFAFYLCACVSECVFECICECECVCLCAYVSVNVPILSEWLCTYLVWICVAVRMKVSLCTCIHECVHE